MIKKLLPLIIAICSLIFSLWIEHQISFKGLHLFAPAAPFVWGLILLSGFTLSFIVASKTVSRRSGFLKYLHLYIIIFALLIATLGNSVRIVFEPNEIYTADILVSGLSNFCTISLYDDSSYRIFAWGCFHSSQLSGTYKVHQDSTYLENMEDLELFIDLDNLYSHSELKFTPVDSTQQELTLAK